MCKMFLCRIPWEALTSIKLKHVENHIILPSKLSIWPPRKQIVRIVPVKKNNQTHGKGLELTIENYMHNSNGTNKKPRRSNGSTVHRHRCACLPLTRDPLMWTPFIEPWSSTKHSSPYKHTKAWERLGKVCGWQGSKIQAIEINVFLITSATYLVH